MSRATITVDLGYGDSGKGTTTEFLATVSKSAAVIRYNGGPQAEHNVILPDGRHHTFSQFGSASFVPDVPTHLSVDMMVNPLNMIPEANHLVELGIGDIWERTTIDWFARIITPYHQVGVRLREMVRGGGRHGSTGQGIAELMMDWIYCPDMVIYAGDLGRPDTVSRLEDLRQYKLRQMSAINAPTDNAEWEMLNNPSLPRLYAEEYAEWTKLFRVVGPDYLAELERRYEHLVFEAAQGVLLDEKSGFHPHTTWSDTTPANAKRQLEEIRFAGSVKTLGILRSYTTRHGYGPLVTEDSALDEPLSEYFTGTGMWQGKFRIGHFDSVAHRYALAVIGGVDGLAVTGLDRTEQLQSWRFATSYDWPLVADVDEFFVGNLVNGACDIKVQRDASKHHMSRLTKLLTLAEPRYARCDSRPESVVRIIEAELGVPVVITSNGPTVNDKTFRM